MASKTKKIDSCIKMFALLKLLQEDNANFNQVISVISDSKDGIPASDNNIYSVTLNKYLNTLKLFGLNVKKEHGKYHLINPTYKIELLPEELKGFNIIKDFINTQSDEENSKKEFNKFIKAFELRLSEQTQMKAKQIESENQADFSFYYETSAKQQEICSKFCKEDYKVEIIYFGNGAHIEKKIIAKAQEILYRKKTIKLQVLNLNNMHTNIISLNKIISIKQLPTKTSTNISPNNTIAFGIRGRLAKNYTMRKWEYLERIDGEWSIIINRGENEEELIKRILKYGDLCKINSPKDFKDKVLAKFDNMLKLYK